LLVSIRIFISLITSRPRLVYITSHASLAVSVVCLVNSGFQILWSYDTYYCIYLYFIIYGTKTVMDFSFYCRHIGLATKTDQTIFGVDTKLHIYIEHLSLIKYCIIVQFEINIDWFIDLTKMSNILLQNCTCVCMWVRACYLIM